jgi:hypothetical protein
MPTYAWTCHTCEASNPAGTEACSQCGFPAVATGDQITRGDPASPFLTKGRFQILMGVVAMLAVLPIAWHVHTTYSLPIQGLFLAFVCAIAYGLRKLIYEPVRTRLPDDPAA